MSRTSSVAKSATWKIFAAELAGTFLIVAFATGSVVINARAGGADLGANAPNYSFPLALIFAVEVLATALLLAVAYAVVRTKGLKGFGGATIGGIIGLDIFFLSFISGASMNPARALAPALLSGAVGDLWLYWSATFVGSIAVAFIAKRKKTSRCRHCCSCRLFPAFAPALSCCRA